MKKLSLLLLAGLLLASCRQSDSEPEHKVLPAGSTLRLDLAGDIPEEGASQNQGKSLDFYIDANSKVRTSLKGKASVVVMTYLYSDNNLVWSGKVNWKVIKNATALRLEDKITTSAPLQVGKAKLVAIIASESSALTQPIIKRQNSVIPLGVSNGTDYVSIDVPYAMQSTIVIKDNGDATNIASTPETNRVFKPYGNILHFTLQNTTDVPITVNALQISDYSVDYAMDPSKTNLEPEMQYPGYERAVTSYPLGGSITVPAGETSDKHLLLWVGTLSRKPAISLIASGVVRSLGYYGTYSPSKTSYQSGKTYHATVKIVEVKNPLSYFATGLVAQTGGSLTPTMSYRPNEIRNQVGFFSNKQVLGQRDLAAEHHPKYPAKYVYSPIPGYRIPTSNNMASIGLMAHGTSGFNAILPKEILDPVPMPADTHSYEELGAQYTKVADAFYLYNYWQVLRENIRSNNRYDENSIPTNRDYVNYALAYITKEGFTPHEVSHYERCFAFRYQWQKAPIYRYVIQCKFVGTTVTSVHDLKNKPESFWADAEMRILPCNIYTDGMGRTAIRSIRPWTTAFPVFDFPENLPNGYYTNSENPGAPIWPYKTGY